MLTYLKNIPVKTIESYFKRTEVESETLSAILETISSKGTTTETECVWAAAFLVALSKADNFELTASFAEDADRERLGKIVKAIRAKCGPDCEEQV